MGIPVLILGESGTGKSASMRNFKVEDIKVINVASKPLPFKNKLECVNVDTYDGILREIKKAEQSSIVVDDSQYIMANEFMRRATERGFDKFTEIAFHMWDIINEVKSLADDKIVYFLSHLDRDNEGNEKVKTIGKLLDEKITLEGMYTIVLKTNVSDGQYSFLTQNSGKDTVKSPIGLFPSYAIDNDLKYVDEKIRNYYELGEFLDDQEIAEIDERVKNVDIEPKKSRKRTEPRTREEVQKSNDHIVANTNVDDTGKDIPFEEADEPVIETLPRKQRKTRSAKEEPVIEEVESMDVEPDTDELKKTRRRRRV